MSNSDRQTDFPGVRIRGNTVWIDFRFKGVRCRESTGLPATKTNTKLADQMRSAIKFDIALGKFNYVDHFPNSNNIERFGGGVKTNMTVSESMDWWYEGSHRSFTENQKTTFLRCSTNHIKPNIGHIFLNDITPRQISNWLDDYGLSPSTISNILTPLRLALKAAYNEGILKRRLDDKLPQYKREAPKKTPFTIEEVDLILRTLKEPFDNFYMFKFWTGLSTGEQLALQWGDIDLANYRISISRQLAKGTILKGPKNGFRIRKIDMLEPAYQALMKIKPSDLDENPRKYTKK